MLADFDPHGIAIMSTYKYGSSTLSHENDHLNIPSIRWLGIKSSDIETNILSCSDNNDQGLLRMSTNDRRKVAKMLQNNAAFAEDRDEGEGEWRRELQIMIMLGVKAEMEILEREEMDVGAWFAGKMRAVEEVVIKEEA